MFSMAQKLSKKGRNPGAVDSWLETLGYYRKNVAYDETCLFRAVSEQLFNIQNYHEKIRTECIEYAIQNTFEFLDLFKNEEQLLDHIDRLEKHMVICGKMEIHLISKKYKCDITVFNAAKQQTQHVVKRDQEKKILLCLMNDDHYDAVYRCEYITAAGFAQSIAYTLLYENVFQIPNVDEIVHGMLYDKTYVTTQPETPLDEKQQELKDTEDAEIIEITERISNLKIAPFPFKVAKALDPSMYRNIEYDSWTEVRREMRLGDWYYGDDKLILGTRCLFNDQLNNQTYDCYIQDIIKNENKCVIYITKLAMKKIVNYTDLSPEDNAKPWPLPYRFTKTLHVPAPLTILPMDKIRAQKKKRDKNKNKIEASNNAAITENSDHGLNAFLGAPLQMQNMQNVQEEQTETTTEACRNSATQDTQNKEMPRYQWDPPYYPYSNVVTPIISESFSWPATPVSPAVFNFNIRPVMTPVPTTPNVMQYCDVNQPQMFNYSVDSYSYPYQTWGQSEVHHSAGMPEQNHNSTENCLKSPQCEDASMEYSHFQDSVTEQPSVCSPPPRVNPTLGMYSPMIQVPPVTPVIYSPPAEIMIPTTPVPMYTSSVEVPYLVPEQYSYPPTPPAWYSLGVNSQGFVFPNPNVQTVVKPN